MTDRVGRFNPSRGVWRVPNRLKTPIQVRDLTQSVARRIHEATIKNICRQNASGPLSSPSFLELPWGVCVFGDAMS